MWGTNYMLVHLRMRVAEPVLVVRIRGRVVLRKCTGYLEKKFVWMFGVLGSCRYDWVFLGRCR